LHRVSLGAENQTPNLTGQTDTAPGVHLLDERQSCGRRERAEIGERLVATGVGALVPTHVAGVLCEITLRRRIRAGSQTDSAAASYGKREPEAQSRERTAGPSARTAIARHAYPRAHPHRDTALYRFLMGR